MYRIELNPVLNLDEFGELELASLDIVMLTGIQTLREV